MTENSIVSVRGKGVTFYISARAGVGIESRLQFFICRPVCRKDSLRFRAAKRQISAGEIKTAADLIDFMHGTIDIRASKKEWMK